MDIRLCATLPCVLAILAVFGTTARAEPAARVAEGPPELRLAVVAGRTLETSRFIERVVTRTVEEGPPGVKIDARKRSFEPIRTEAFTLIETQTDKFDLDEITARRMDGRTVSRQALVGDLAKPTPVVFVKRGEQIDPRFAKMFKPEILVLQYASSPTGLPHASIPTAFPAGSEPFSPFYSPNPKATTKPATKRSRQR